MAEGTVTARAYTSRAMIPIEHATITFTQTGPDGRRTLLAVRVTDESGLTVPVTIPTPERIEGLSPEQARPYALLDIAAFHPGYERILVENVQVFPGIRTLQNLEMIPLEEYPASANETEIFDLPPQNL